MKGLFLLLKATLEQIILIEILKNHLHMFGPTCMTVWGNAPVSDQISKWKNLLCKCSINRKLQ